MMMSLAETSGGGGAAAQLDSDTLDEVMAMQRSGNMNQEEELEMALRLSQHQVYFSSKCCSLIILFLSAPAASPSARGIRGR